MTQDSLLDLIAAEIERLTRVRELLARNLPDTTTTNGHHTIKKERKKRRISKAGLENIRRAAKKRWREAKKAGRTTLSS